MKTKLFLLFIALMAVNVNSASSDVDTSLREIILKSKNPVRPRMLTSQQSPESMPCLDTYMVGSAVAVNFTLPAADVSILVTNIKTGEVVHHEIFSSNNATTLLINMDGCYGEYSIDIDSKTDSLYGEFLLKLQGNKIS